MISERVLTPLMIQRSQLEAMEDGMIEAGPTGLRSLLEENQRLSRLVADLGALGSAEAARFSLQRREIDLAEAIRDAAAGFASLFEQKGIALSIDVQPVRSEADPERVGQMVANLLSNALKHTRRGGRVSVQLRPAGPWAVLGVRDSGRGIADEDLPRVFERFCRGRQPTCRASKTGPPFTPASHRRHSLWS